MSFRFSAIHQSARLSASRHQLPFRFSVNQLGRSEWRTMSSATTGDLRGVGLTVFRQLLRWCRNTDSGIPLDSSIPPLTIGSPFVDAVSLERLRSGSESFSWDLLPTDTKCDEHGMTIPLRNSIGIRNTVRAIYRMNAAENVDDDALQQRVGKAFEALKSLNDLSEVLDKYRAARDRHLDRTGVSFRIGQVVQHKKARWRGIIIGWERIQQLPEEQPTSLTTKDYPSPEEVVSDQQGDRILYKVILDAIDATIILSKTSHEDNHVESTYQSELDPVTDGRLCRIQHDPIDSPFDRFDGRTSSFIPNKAMQYQYPVDIEMDASGTEDCDAESLNLICSGVSDAIQRFAVRLESGILRPAFHNESSVQIMQALFLQLKALSSGDSSDDNKRLAATNSPIMRAARQLRTFHSLTLGVGDLLRQRRAAAELANSLRFRLGDIVQHKKHGFRGIVVGWLSESDAVRSVFDQSDQHMYVILPDKGDFKKTFGYVSSKTLYASEEGLEKCPRDQTALNVDFHEPGWKKDTMHERYIAPAPLKFACGEKSDDVETTERYCEELYEELNMLNLVQRGFSHLGDDEIQEMGAALSIDVLFRWLKLADNVESARIIERAIVEVWRAHPNPTFRARLDDARALLEKQDGMHTALFEAQKLLLDDPDYAEAWHLVASCNLVVNLYETLHAAEKTVELIPRHYDAMALQGIVHQHVTGEHGMAANCLGECVSLDPWSASACCLSQTLDLIHKSYEECETSQRVIHLDTTTVEEYRLDGKPSID